MDTSTVLLISTIVAVKLFFGFLGWYSAEEGDSLLRSKLDVIWERIHAKSPGEVVSIALSRFFRKTTEIRVNPMFYLAVFVLGYLLNFYCYYAIDNHYYSIAGLVYLDEDKFFYAMGEGGAPKPILILFAVCFWLSLFDVLSFYITLNLVRWIGDRRGAVTLTPYLAVDAATIYLAIGWAGYIHWHIWLWDEFDMYYLPRHYTIHWETFTTEPMRAIVDMIRSIVSVNESRKSAYVFVSAISSALPTIAYSSVVSACLIIRYTPRRLWSVFVKILFRLTTTDRPVLSQLGNFCAGLIAILGIVQRLSA